MKNNKIVKYLKNGKYYYIFAYFENLYVCYELMGYFPLIEHNETPEILTNVIRQHLFDKDELQYLTKKEIYMLNYTPTKYQADFIQFNEEFEDEYEMNDTHDGQLAILEKENNLWCKMIEEF